MIYVRSSLPKPSEGVRIKSPKIVVPDQSMSLQEILLRFTRGEQLPVAKEEQFGGNDDPDDPLAYDLEKLAKADLTERDEVAEQISNIRAEHEKHEKASNKKKAEAKAKADKEAEEKRISDEVEKRTKQGRTDPSI